MAKNSTNVTLGARRVFANLSAAYFTPWVAKDKDTEGNEVYGEDKLGEKTYDLVDIVADSTSVEQAENESSAIDHEFSGAPLFENISLGEKTFTTECIDLQNDILKAMFGWETDANGNALAPAGYKPLYCHVELHFNSTEDILVLPKVLLNSRAVIASMKTDVSRANITGTCYPAYISAGAAKGMTDMAIIAKANKDLYTVAKDEASAA